MSDTTKLTSAKDPGVKPGDNLVIHRSEPASRWQRWKERHLWRWYLHWYVRLFPVRYRRWEEKAEVLDVKSSTELTIGEPK